MAIGIVRIVLTLIPAFDDHVGSQIQYEAGTIAEVLDQEFVEPVVNFSLGNIIPSSSETLPIIARTGTVCFFAGSY